MSFNHSRFLVEALDSVLAQTYPNWELIIVDDASTDDSAAVVRAWVAAHPGRAAHVLLLPVSTGACAAFNHGLARCQGEFIVDLATDDILLPPRLAEQVAAFAALDASYGVVYTDAELIDEAGAVLRHQYRRDAVGRPYPAAPSGDVFAHVLGHYFISAPTMMIRRRILTALGGYDATLAYEDFDFWVRSAREWRYCFLDQILTRKRLHPRSHSRGFYRPDDPQLASTIRVCHKARVLCQTPAEWAGLRRRVRFELRQAVRYGCWPEARALARLLGTLPGVPLVVRWVLQDVLRLQPVR
ncbi:MAG: glycosyltransferase [Hymenobacteraceae bacterium]|nr:glycosyltransferase [Hymenobacteraceae bacterium]